jgi:hypothetical protein
MESGKFWVKNIFCKIFSNVQIFAHLHSKIAKSVHVSNQETVYTIYIFLLTNLNGSLEGSG